MAETCTVFVGSETVG